MGTPPWIGAIAAAWWRCAGKAARLAARNPSRKRSGALAWHVVCATWRARRIRHVEVGGIGTANRFHRTSLCGKRRWDYALQSAVDKQISRESSCGRTQHRTDGMCVVRRRQEHPREIPLAWPRSPPPCAAIDIHRAFPERRSAGRSVGASEGSLSICLFLSPPQPRFPRIVFGFVVQSPICSSLSASIHEDVFVI